MLDRPTFLFPFHLDTSKSREYGGICGRDGYAFFQPAQEPFGVGKGVIAVISSEQTSGYWQCVQKMGEHFFD